MRDDAVGVIAAEHLGREVEADVITGTARGLALLDQLEGYDRAIIVDATQSGDDAPGTVRRAHIDPASSVAPMGGPHEMSAAAMLGWARRTGYALPEHLAVYTVQAADVSTVGEELSAAVEKAIPQLVQRVVREQFSPTPAGAEREQGP